jgi:hypothetical protein
LSNDTLTAVLIAVFAITNISLLFARRVFEIYKRAGWQDSLSDNSAAVRALILTQPTRRGSPSPRRPNRQ